VSDDDKTLILRAVNWDWDRYHEVAGRRFGRGHAKPCANSRMVECTAAECQLRDRCRLLSDETPKRRLA
jgi:hypothetical protein